MATTEQYLDGLGRVLSIGDRVVVSQRRSSSCWLATGRVTNLRMEKRWYSGEPQPLVEITFDDTNRKSKGRFPDECIIVEKASEAL